jgi:succinate-semialdehyde dehydrogenase
MGVVAAITPCTNPIVTPMSNAMFALKGGNAIIITPHHKSIGCSTRTVELINDELAKLGMPEHLIQILDVQSRENTKNLISSADVVIATGGMGMVNAAYSSGRPALGVGAGNVQCIIDENYDYSVAVPKIIAGRSFDNGIICSGEQSVICPASKFEEVLQEFEKNGAFVVRTPEQKEAFRKAIFDEEGHMSRHAVGQSCQSIAALAKINIPENTRVIVIEADGFGAADILSKEKMCPVLSAYPYHSFDEAVEIARANLEEEGKGHSVAIHSDNKEHIEQVGSRTLRFKVPGQPDLCHQRRRQLLQRPGPHQYPGLRLLGPQQHLRKSGLQAPDQHLPDCLLHARQSGPANFISSF